jgi:hypothetical protein
MNFLTLFQVPLLNPQTNVAPFRRDGYKYLDRFHTHLPHQIQYATTSSKSDASTTYVGFMFDSDETLELKTCRLSWGCEVF